MSGDLVGIGNDSVNNFEAVAIGFVLKVAADAVECRGREENQQRNYEYQGREGCQILEVANPPLCTPAREHSVGEAVEQVEQEKNNDGVDPDFFGDMVQDVVTHFVSEDEEGLGDGGLGDGVIPDHDSLGRAESGDVGVE